jgi:hypothetical protein
MCGGVHLADIRFSFKPGTREWGDTKNKRVRGHWICSTYASHQIGVPRFQPGRKITCICED